MRDDARVIGRQLGARYLVEGSVQHVGSHLRITAQLVDATDGGHVWSMMFDRAATDVLAIEDDVSQRIARGICTSLLPPPAPPLAATAWAYGDA